MGRWLGIVVSGDRVTAIDADVPVVGPLVIQGDYSWPIPEGPRPAAYNVMHQRVLNYVRENGIESVIVKDSALSLSGGAKLAHLHSAELRGVVAAAASSITQTKFLAKAKISRTFGDRKVDEYLKDENFWQTEITGKPIRVGSREAAMILIAARGK